MSMAEWVLKHKEPKTEIKLIISSYYYYKVSYKYNKDKRRTDKITEQLLGRIDEELGFVKSNKNTLREQAIAVALPKFDMKNYGACFLFYTLLTDEIMLFKKHFKESIADTFFILAMMRWAFQSPIKRVPSYFIHFYCSEFYSKTSLSDTDFSNALKFEGENREALTQWMKDLSNPHYALEFHYSLSSFSGKKLKCNSPRWNKFLRGKSAIYPVGLIYPTE